MGPLIDQKLEDIDRYIVTCFATTVLGREKRKSKGHKTFVPQIFSEGKHLCLHQQEALRAVRAECEGDGSSVFVCQADERRSSLRHVCQAAEPAVLHAAACQRSTTGEVNLS